MKSRINDLRARLDALECRVDYSVDQVEKWAQEMRGLRGSGGKIPTSRDLIRKEREEAMRRSRESRGGRIPGPSGAGKPCGKAYINSKYRCEQDRTEEYQPGEGTPDKDFRKACRAAGRALAKALQGNEA